MARNPLPESALSASGGPPPQAGQDSGSDCLYTQFQSACRDARHPPGSCQLVPTMPRSCLAAVLVAVTLFASPAAAGADEITVFPATISLHGKASRQRLLVSLAAQGKTMDGTRDAKFHSETPAVAVVSADGIVTPMGDGAA